MSNLVGKGYLAPMTLTGTFENHGKLMNCDTATRSIQGNHRTSCGKKLKNLQNFVQAPNCCMSMHRTADVWFSLVEKIELWDSLWHLSACNLCRLFGIWTEPKWKSMEILGIPALVARAWSQHRSVPAPGRQSQSAQWQQWQHKTSRLSRKEVENHVARLWLLACSAYRSTVHSYAAPLWLLPLCLSDMGQSQRARKAANQWFLSQILH